MRNPEDLGGWIGQVHGACDTVRTSFRPVPLTWHYCHLVAGDCRLLPLLAPGARAINPELLPPARRLERGGGGDAQWGRWDGLRSGRVRWAPPYAVCRREEVKRRGAGAALIASQRLSPWLPPPLADLLCALRPGLARWRSWSAR